MTFVLNSIYEWDYYMLCRSAHFLSHSFRWVCQQLSPKEFRILVNIVHVVVRKFVNASLHAVWASLLWCMNSIAHHLQFAVSHISGPGIPLSEESLPSFSSPLESQSEGGPYRAQHFDHLLACCYCNVWEYLYVPILALHETEVLMAGNVNLIFFTGVVLCGLASGFCQFEAACWCIQNRRPLSLAIAGCFKASCMHAQLSVPSWILFC